MMFCQITFNGIIGQKNLFAIISLISQIDHFAMIAQMNFFAIIAQIDLFAIIAQTNFLAQNCPKLVFNSVSLDNTKQLTTVGQGLAAFKQGTILKGKSQYI